MLSGDIELCPGPTLQICYQNVEKYLQSFNYQLSERSFDMIAISESWLRPDILNSEILSDSNYNIYRRDRGSVPSSHSRKKCGDGVMIAVKSTFSQRRGQTLEQTWKLCGVS